jgi:hypothetical protein
VRQPWERMAEAGESEAAYQAFTLYRDQTPGRRSITAVARECAKNRSLIARWSARYEWLQRVAAYDAWIDAQRVATQVEALTEMWRRQASMAMLGQQQALAWLQQVDPTQLRDEVGLRLLTEMTKLERIARGAQVDDGEGVLEPAGPVRTLAELFAPAGPGETRVTELELARIVVERHQRPRVDEDLDLELAELLDEGEDPDDDDGGGDDDDPAAAPWLAAAVVPASDPEPEEPADPPREQPEVDEVAQAWQWLRGNPHRPPAGPELVQWLRARRLVGLDPEPSDRPRPRRYRRRAS